jgi:NaMN:DMB phosphoribosyltransferase
MTRSQRRQLEGLAVLLYYIVKTGVIIGAATFAVLIAEALMVWLTIKIFG